MWALSTVPSSEDGPRRRGLERWTGGSEQQTIFCQGASFKNYMISKFGGYALVVVFPLV